MIARFLESLRFLTVLPVRGEASSPGKAAVFFPFTGALLGASAGVIKLACHPSLGPSIAALLALVWLLAVTGCLHEDGLADVADAVRAGRSREKMFAILKDSRVGTYAAIALIVSLAVRWQALAQSTVHPVAGLAAALSLSRASMPALAALSSAQGSGLGQAFVSECSRGVLVVVAAESIALVALAGVFVGWGYATALVAATISITLLARAYFAKRLGGVNGDCLGATCQTVEMVNLVILAWHRSS